MSNSDHFMTTSEIREMVGYPGSLESFRAFFRLTATRMRDPNPTWKRIWSLRLKVGRSYRYPRQRVLEILGVVDAG